MTPHIHVEGSGPDLVLLHGWSMNAAVWRSLATELARDFRVHAVELGSFAVTPDELAAALPARVTVCGWSLGGQLALAWAQRFPKQVSRLVLLATTPRFVAADDWLHGMTSTEFEEFASEVADDPPRARMRFLALQATGDAAARLVLRDLRAANEDGSEADAGALMAGLALLRETDLRAELHVIGQPALVMHGVNDSVIPHAAGEYLARALPQAAFESVAGAGHAFFVTREAAVAHSIRTFHE
jgi:pimeloyl-[acyl-carrier protein] methyl ester esterase